MPVFFDDCNYKHSREAMIIMVLIMAVLIMGVILICIIRANSTVQYDVGDLVQIGATDTYGQITKKAIKGEYTVLYADKNGEIHTGVFRAHELSPDTRKN